MYFKKKIILSNPLIAYVSSNLCLVFTNYIYLILFKIFFKYLYDILTVLSVGGLLQREEGGGVVKGDRPLGPVYSVKASSQPVYALTHTPACLVAGSTGSLSVSK